MIDGRSPVGSRSAGRHLTRTAAHALVRRAARRYTAGPRISDAIAVAGQAIDHGAHATIAAWTSPDISAEQALDAHLQAVSAVRKARFDAVVAVKTGALRHRRELIDEVVAAAASADVELCFDAHDAPSSTRTLAAAARAVADGHATIGVALPGRWARSVLDARAAREQGQIVRIVKGQWPAENGGDLRADDGMLRIARALAAYDHTVRVATHDVPLLAALVVLLQHVSTPVEVELLVGLPLRPPAQLARSLGAPVRLYIPFGSADLPYEYADARHDPVIARRLIHDVLHAPSPR